MIRFGVLKDQTIIFGHVRNQFQYPPKLKSFTLLYRDQNRCNTANQLSLTADQMFDKVLFISYLPYKLSQEVEMWYVHLVRVRDVLFEGLNFSVRLHFLTASKMWVFDRSFLFFEFVLRITPL